MSRNTHPFAQYSAAIKAASPKERAAHIVNALRYIIKDRAYYVDFIWTAEERPNLWNSAEAFGVPHNGLERSCSNLVRPGILQILGITKGGMGEKVITRMMAYMEMSNEVFIFRVGTHIYYHLLSGSPLDRAILPAYGAIMRTVERRGGYTPNPFTTRDGSDRCETCQLCRVCHSRGRPRSRPYVHTIEEESDDKDNTIMSSPEYSLMLSPDYSVDSLVTTDSCSSSSCPSTPMIPFTPYPASFEMWEDESPRALPTHSQIEEHYDLPAIPDLPPWKNNE